MERLIRNSKILVMVTLLVVTGTAVAFDIPPPPPPPYDGLIVPLFPNSPDSVTSTGTVPTTAASKTTKKITLAPSITGIPKGPKKLATGFPRAQRKAIEKAFFLSYRTYIKLEKRLGIPKNDVAGAVAAYLAGNYMAYHATEVPDQVFNTLVDQMRGLLVNISAFKTAKKSIKRDLYEQLAIGGTFMVLASLASKQQPENQILADNIRSTAKTNLERFLGVGADRVEINDAGLTIH